MSLTRAKIWNLIVECLQLQLEETGLEIDDIEPTNTLEELGVSSIDAMHLLISLEERLGQAVSFQKMVSEDGQYNKDATMTELLDAVCSMVL